MAKKKNTRRDRGRPYVRIHNGYWHLFYRNPDPAKTYPAHRSLRLRAEQVQEAETVEAEARLVWKQCEARFRVSPEAVEKVFDRFVQEKTAGQEQEAASRSASRYIEKNLGELFDAFLASKENKAKRTRRTYSTHVANLRRLMDCGQPAAEVSPDGVREYLRNRVHRDGVHKTTANKELTTLRGVFIFGQKRGYVQGNPAGMTDKFSLDAEDRDQLSGPVYITPETYRLLIGARAARSNAPVRGVMFLLYHTGMRIGELLRLKWGDVDLRNHVLRVTASAQKGGDRNPYMVSRSLRRYLSFTKRRAEKAYRDGEWGTDLPFDRIAVIANGHGRSWTYTNLAQRAWRPFLEAFALENAHGYRRLQEAAGVTAPDARPISFHDFRHTFITDLLVKGINPIVVGWLVGHKELHTQRRYTHLCYQHFQKEFEGFQR